MKRSGIRALQAGKMCSRESNRKKTQNAIRRGSQGESALEAAPNGVLRFPLVPGGRGDAFTPQFNSDRRARVLLLRKGSSHIAQTYTGIGAWAPAYGRQFAYRFATDDDAFAAPRISIGGIKHDGDEFLFEGQRAQFS